MKTLHDIAAANRAGRPVGIPAWRTTQPETLRAVLATYADDDEPVLVEVSAEAVNPAGGYAGLTPAGFRNFIDILAAGEGVDPARLILGGARLGPGPWRHEPAAGAMGKAQAAIAAAVEAGFTKLHLDASVPCADDPPLRDDDKVRRVARLCAAAEAAARGRPLLYVIGLDAGPDGGQPVGHSPVLPTTRAAIHRSLELHEAAFTEAGLGAVLERIIGIAAEPGADFDNAVVYPFAAGEAAELAETIFDIPDAVFEASSADYQSGAALAGMLAAHFGILGVGPELTFAFREAVVAMAHIESHLDVQPSGVLDQLTAEMDRDPAPWRAHVPEDGRDTTTRLFGYADRARFYWPRPAIAAALQQLFANIDGARPDFGLLSQYAPDRLAGGGTGRGPLSAQIIADHVQPVVARFRRAAEAR